MPQPIHPAVSLLVQAVNQRLQAPSLPPSAVRGALLEALENTAEPEGRLTRWTASVTWDTAKILCRRLGVDMPDMPSIAASEDAPRDWSAEIVAALLHELDPDVAEVLRHLEVHDARPPQVAVQLGLTPQRIGVKARQGRAAIRSALVSLARGD